MAIVSEQSPIDTATHLWKALQEGLIVPGKKRIDWQNDPPPDLVIEIDVTSYSDVQDYLPYRVPEVWLFKKQQLLIYQLQGGEYQLQTQSIYFPDFDLISAIARCIEIA